MGPVPSVIVNVAVTVLVPMRVAPLLGTVMHAITEYAGPGELVVQCEAAWTRWTIGDKPPAVITIRMAATEAATSRPRGRRLRFVVPPFVHLECQSS